MSVPLKQINVQIIPGVSTLQAHTAVNAGLGLQRLGKFVRVRHG